MRAPLLIVSAVLAVAGSSPRAATISAAPVFRLADDAGPVALDWATLAHDPVTREVLVVAGGIVRVFSTSGMEVYAFGGDPALGAIASAVVLDDGDILALSTVRGRWALLRCSFRGALMGRVEPTGTPAGFLEGFAPTVLRRRGDALYLADLDRMRVLVIGPDGAHRAAHDLRAVVQVPPGREADATLGGFDVDANGALYFTLPMLFRAQIVPPSGEPRVWGRPGSAPGRFNVVSGITVDANGHVFVADALRSVVMVFGPDLEFLGEFGYRGSREANLVIPRELLLANDLLYVSQAGGRGVSAFRVTVAPAAVPPGEQGEQARGSAPAAAPGR